MCGLQAETKDSQHQIHVTYLQIPKLAIWPRDRRWRSQITRASKSGGSEWRVILECSGVLGRTRCLWGSPKVKRGSLGHRSQITGDVSQRDPTGNQWADSPYKRFQSRASWLQLQKSRNFFWSLREPKKALSGMYGRTSSSCPCEMEVQSCWTRRGLPVKKGVFQKIRHDWEVNLGNLMSPRACQLG